MDYKEISPKKRISHVERNAGISTSLVKHKKAKRDANAKKGKEISGKKKPRNNKRKHNEEPEESSDTEESEDEPVLPVKLLSNKKEANGRIPGNPYFEKRR